MKIWFEALTGKQAILFHHIAEFFEQHGHEILFTTRKSDYTEANLNRLQREYISIGAYGGASFKNKLIAGSKRIIELADLVDQANVDVLVSFSSPDATRTAFGLAIPIILLNDTPHARAVAKLTFSISEALVYPEAINQEDFSRYGVTSFYPYAGVDEVLWVKKHRYDPSVLDALDLEEFRYLVLRCEESKAAYFQKIYPDITPGSTILHEVVTKLLKNDLDYKIVAFPRYQEQKEILESVDVIIPDQSVDTLSLLAKAKVAMTGGGTMGREAALLGTPTMYSFPKELAVSTYIGNLGFPILHFPHHLQVPDKLIELLNMPRMEEEKRKVLIEDIETPISGILRAMNSELGVNIDN